MRYDKSKSIFMKQKQTKITPLNTKKNELGCIGGGQGEGD